MIEIPEEDVEIALPWSLTKTMLEKIEVLIVDDTYFNVMALTHVLKTEGFNCSFSLNGEDAITKIKKNDFACVLMDCEMPILNGWETTKRLYELKLNHELRFVPPIIGCTAHSTERIRLQCLEAGMNDVIIKPCPKNSIVSKIMFWVENSKQT